MTQVQNILRLLDEKYEEFEFPILENDNFDFVAGKLTLFTDKENNWCILFQLFCLSRIGPQIAAYFIGNEINTQNNLYLTDAFKFISNNGEYIDFEEMEEGFIFKENLISVNGHLFIIPGWNEEKSNHNVSVKNEWVTFLRQIADRKEWMKQIWLSLDEQMEIAQISTRYKLFYYTENWQHPYIDGDPPSQIQFFSLLALAISKNDPTIIKEENTNTTWDQWAVYDSVKYY